MTIMKKLISILSLGILLFAGCQTEELDTNQYSDTRVKLVSFGPNPVMRGATLCFYGSNLDKVTSVEVPGIDAITEIEVVKSGNPSEIRIQLPKDGTTVGVVKLTASDGTVLTTQSELTYTEPIVFEGFSATSAMPGDVIKISGDYMNLVTDVIFADEVTVPVNEGATRYETSVTVPANAITGEPILTDGENLIYSFTAITIGDPTVSSLAVADPRPGKKAVVSGKYLNMIKTVTFAGDVAVDTSAFTLNEGFTTLSLDIPATAKSGEVTLTSYAGKDFVAGSVTMTLPSGIAVSPTPVKAGANLVITGQNLDLVTAVNFDGAAGASFSYADGTITVAVPATAKEGEVSLAMANGESAAAAFTLVHPTVTAIDPTTITAGDTITVTGTDLDLITGVTLGGRNEEFTATETSVKITTAATSVAGKIVLKLANGETVAPDQDITVNYDAYIVVTDMPASAPLNSSVTLKGSNFNMIENIYLDDFKVTRYGTRSENEITFVVPGDKPGTYALKFQLFDGTIETNPTPFVATAELIFRTLWSGNANIGDWGGMQDLAWGAFDWSTVPAGGTLRFTLEQDNTAGWWQLALRHGDNWGELPEGVFIEMTSGQTVVEVVLTPTNLADIIANNGLVVTGCFYTLYSIEYITEMSYEVTVWEGPSGHTGDYATNMELGGEDDWVNAGLYDGAEIRIYFTPDDPADWSIQVFDGHWNGMGYVTPNGTQWNVENTPDGATKGYVSFIATGDAFTALTTKAWWGFALILQGKNMVFTKLAFI